MIRKIIEIDQNKCNGCKACIQICSEAALKIENGKAKLIKDFYCDGMGECLNVCPVNALKIVEKECNEYNPQKISQNIKQVKKELITNNIHSFHQIKPNTQLNQWPIQLKLLQPSAIFFKNSDLTIAADCTAFSYPYFHKRFAKNKTLIILCPKLDVNIDEYIQKLTTIFKTQNIKSITTVKMQVPCCIGIERIVKDAIQLSQKNINIQNYTISTTGKLI